MLTHENLHGYQQEGIDFAYEHDEALILVKMGGGKTVVAATALCELLELGLVKRALIVAPKRVAELVWPAEFKKWDHLKYMNPAFAIGPPVKRRKAFASKAPIVVIGVDNLLWAINDGQLSDFDMLIFDDCMPRGHTGTLFKALKKVPIKMRWGLTGTVTSTKHLADLFARAYCIDGGKRLGKSFAKFRALNFDYRGPNQWNWTPKDGALERVMDKIADITYTVETYDGLPPIVVNDIWVDLPPAARLAYDQMEKTYVHDGVDAANAGVKAIKLQQMAQGFLYGATFGGQPENVKHLHTTKLDALAEVLEGDQNTLVAYAFREDLTMLRKRWPADDLTVKGAYEKWNSGAAPLMYLHPKSAGHGLNLQAGGDTIVWYGLTWDLELYEQTIARLRRQGQASAQVWVHRILARNTVDEDMVYRLEHNCTTREAIERGLKRRQVG